MFELIGILLFIVAGILLYNAGVFENDIAIAGFIAAFIVVNAVYWAFKQTLNLAKLAEILLLSFICWFAISNLT